MLYINDMKLNYIILFIIVFIGCGDSYKSNILYYDEYTDDTPWYTQYNCESYYIEMESYLYKDSHGYYYMQWLEGYTQTFTTISAHTGSINSYQKVKFLSNKEIFLNNDWVNLINSNSYTDENGISNGVIGVWEEFIGDTVTVYSGYHDECGNNYMDSILIIINEI